MSTHSTITIQHPDNSYDSVYCHWDGYLEWNGQLLYAFYNTSEKVQELINYGDMSALGMNIGEQIDGRSFDLKRVTNFQCEFYARDRGETTHIAHGNNINKIAAQDYNYVFDEKDGVWYVYRDNIKDMKPLKDALIEQYRESGYDIDFLFKPDTSFHIPDTDNEISIKDIATSEQLARLDVLRDDITGELPKCLTLVNYDCTDDLANVTLSADEAIANADFSDEKGNTINLRIEPSPSHRQLIAVYTIANAADGIIAFNGEDLQCSLSEMTPNDLKDYLANYAESLYLHYEKEIAENTVPPKQKGDAEREV